MEVEFFAVGGGDFRSSIFILINTSGIFMVVKLNYGRWGLETSLIILFY